jgi:hypothetical protein
MSRIDDDYRARMAALSGRERVARSLAQLQWAWDMIARQMLAERADLSPQRLKWEVALRLYGADPTTRRMIESKLTDVPR